MKNFIELLVAGFFIHNLFFHFQETYENAYEYILFIGDGFMTVFNFFMNNV